MEQRIAAEVRKRFAGMMDLEAAGLDMEADLVDRYGVDSLKALRLVSEIEVALDVDIPEDEMEKIHTLGDVVRLCLAHGKDKTAG